MKKIIISKDLLKTCPDIQLGCIQYNTEVKDGSEELWNEISNVIKK